MLRCPRQLAERAARVQPVEPAVQFRDGAFQRRSAKGGGPRHAKPEGPSQHFLVDRGRLLQEGLRPWPQSGRTAGSGGRQRGGQCANAAEQIMRASGTRGRGAGGLAAQLPKAFVQRVVECGGSPAAGANGCHHLQGVLQALQKTRRNQGAIAQFVQAGRQAPPARPRDFRYRRWRRSAARPAAGCECRTSCRSARGSVPDRAWCAARDVSARPGPCPADNPGHRPPSPESRPMPMLVGLVRVATVRGECVCTLSGGSQCSFSFAKVSK